MTETTATAGSPRNPGRGRQFVCLLFEENDAENQSAKIAAEMARQCSKHIAERDPNLNVELASIVGATIIKHRLSLAEMSKYVLPELWPQLNVC